MDKTASLSAATANGRVHATPSYPCHPAAKELSVHALSGFPLEKQNILLTPSKGEYERYESRAFTCVPERFSITIPLTCEIALAHCNRGKNAG